MTSQVQGSASKYLVYFQSFSLSLYWFVYCLRIGFLLYESFLKLNALYIYCQHEHEILTTEHVFDKN